jgi:disulfide bond formation protein DsbB
MRPNGLATARWIALLVPLVLIGGALGSQFLGGLVPCEMCMWQRWPHYAAIAVALLAFVAPGRPLKLLLTLLAGVLIAVSGGIGVYHAGVEYRWWLGPPHCSSTQAGFDVLALMRGPLVRCDVPQWTLFGISLAGFNALFSLAGALAILVAAPWKPRP